MLVDITLKITREIIESSPKDKNLKGHLGTHFDVMNKEFPLEYTERDGIVFDISKIIHRDIAPADIDIRRIKSGMFVAFYSGYAEKVGYTEKVYFKEHPQLSTELIDLLLNKNISIIGVDFAGIRRGAEHTPADQYCADRGTFVVENLCNLNAVLKHGELFKAHTYPMNFSDMTGIPCRVIAQPYIY